MNLRLIYKNHKDKILYIIFGGLTTIINIFAYWIMAYFFRFSVVPSTVVAWIIAVAFAYVVDRKWVFGSNAHSFNAIMHEVFSFFACRLATGFLDLSCMYIFVDILQFYDVAVKTIINAVVIILNFVFSKFVVFKKINE